MAFYEYEDKQTYNQRQARRFTTQTLTGAAEKPTVRGVPTFLDTVLDVIDWPQDLIAGAALDVLRGQPPRLRGLRDEVSGADILRQLGITPEQSALGGRVPLNQPLFGVPEGIPVVSGALTPFTAASFLAETGTDPTLFFGGPLLKGASRVAAPVLRPLVESARLSAPALAAARTLSPTGKVGLVAPELKEAVRILRAQKASAAQVAQFAVNEELLRQFGRLPEDFLRELHVNLLDLPQVNRELEIGRRVLDKAVEIVERPTVRLADGTKAWAVSIVDDLGNPLRVEDFPVKQLYRAPREVSRLRRELKQLGQNVPEGEAFFDTPLRDVINLALPAVQAAQAAGERVPRALKDFLARYNRVSEAIHAWKPYRPEEKAVRAQVLNFIRKEAADAGVSEPVINSYFPGFVETFQRVNYDPRKARKFVTRLERLEAGYIPLPADEALTEWVKVSRIMGARDAFRRHMEALAVLKPREVTLAQPEDLAEFLDTEKRVLLGPDKKPLFVLAEAGDTEPLALGYRELRETRPKVRGEPTAGISELSPFAAGAEETVGIAKGRRLLVREEIADDVARYLDVLQGVNPGPVFTALDFLSSIWKWFVLTWPSKFVRDWVSDAFSGFYLAGMNSQETATTLRRAYQLLWRQQPDAHTQQLFARFGIQDTNSMRRTLLDRRVAQAGQFAEFFEQVRNLRGRIPQASPLTNIGQMLRGVGELATLPHRMNQAVEDLFRTAHFLWRLEKGDTLEAAAQSVWKYLFDYSDLTDVERRVIRTFVPFYSWLRHNIPLQLEMMATVPQKYVALARIRNAADPQQSLTPDELRTLVDWLDETFAVNIGFDEEGNLKVVGSTGLPVEDLNKLWVRDWRETARVLLGQTNPVLLAPIEFITDWSTFTGKPISDPSFQNYYRGAYNYLAAVPGLRNWLELEEHTYVDDKGIQRSFYTANPRKMYWFLLLASRFYIGAGKLTDVRKNLPERIVNVLTGMKIYSIDLYRQGRIWNINMQQAREEANANLEDLAKAFQAGKITGNQWREERAKILTKKRALIDNEYRRLLEQENLPEKQAIIQRFFTDVDSIVDRYWSLTPEMFMGAGGVPDYQAYYAARQEILDSVTDPQVRAEVKRRLEGYIKRLPPQAAAVEKRFQRALDLYRLYRQMAPQFFGVSEKTATEMENALLRRAAYRRSLGPELGDALFSIVAPEEAALALVAQKLRNPFRTEIWRALNRSSGGLLAEFFSDLSPLDVDFMTELGLLTTPGSAAAQRAS